MAARIGTVSGTALVPGISRNGRLYTRETIASAVARAQERIAAGTEPLTMLTHHAAGDDSTRIVGSLTSLTLAEDGSAKFTADLADTDHARTIARLGSGATPHLRGVSIRGAWLGKVHREPGPAGRTVERGDDLELDGLDFTRTPGVVGAEVDDISLDSPPAETAAGRHMIYESAEALVTITEDTTAQLAEAEAQASGTSGPYADPGYQADKKKRYDLSTKARAKAAWSYINQADNAKLYTAAQLKRIKGRIKGALKKFGVTITAESWLVDTVAEAVPAITEYYPEYGEPVGSFCLNATNGPLSVSVSSYCIDPADLELILHAVVDGAVGALKAIDPDLDGDMDVPGADSEDTDGDMETAPASAGQLAETTPPGLAAAPAAPETPADPPAGTPEPTAPEPAADQPTKEEPAMAESTPAVEPAPAAQPTSFTLTNDQFQQLLAAARGPQPAAAAAETGPAPAQPAAETAPAAPAPAASAAPAAPAAPVGETTEQMIARLVKEGVAAERTAMIQEMAANGGLPARKGVVDTPNAATGQPAVAEGLNEYGVPNTWPNKPLHQYTTEERLKYFGRAVREHVLQDRFKG